MLTITLVSLAALAAITGSAFAYQRIDARSVILAFEAYLVKNGRVTTSEIKKFRNQKEFQSFIDEEKTHAENIPNQPENLHGIKNIYVITGDEEILREMVRNFKTHDDVKKYMNKPPKGVAFYTIK